MIWIPIALVAAIAVLAFTGHKKVHAERILPASPETIWSVITNASGYSKWNPVFTSVEGTYGPGATMTYQMRDQSGKDTKVDAKVIKFDVAPELNQFGGFPAVLTFDHHWILEPTETGTKVIQHEEYRGIGVWFWDPSWFETAYGQAIDALNNHIAGGAPPT